MSDSAEKDAGLEARYHVEKINDPTGKHDDCRYFVLDPQHDPIAREALQAYALHARDAGYEALYQDILSWLTGLAFGPSAADASRRPSACYDDCYDDHGDSRTRVPHVHVTPPADPTATDEAAR